MRWTGRMVGLSMSWSLMLKAFRTVFAKQRAILVVTKRSDEFVSQTSWTWRDQQERWINTIMAA